MADAFDYFRAMSGAGFVMQTVSALRTQTSGLHGRVGRQKNRFQQAFHFQQYLIHYQVKVVKQVGARQHWRVAFETTVFHIFLSE